jgi:hypothetical protein
VRPLSVNAQDQLESLGVVRGLLEQYVGGNELVIPTLPAVAVRVVRSGTKNSGSAHMLAEIIHADYTLHEPSMLTRELLVMDQGYRDLGLSAQDAEPLFDSSVAINAELDRYLSP